MQAASRGRTSRGSRFEFPPSAPRSKSSALSPPTVIVIDDDEDDAVVLPLCIKAETARQHAVSTSPGQELFTPPQPIPQRKRPRSDQGDGQPSTNKRRLSTTPLPKLNEQQQQAVTSSIHKPSLIIAGAGSGKTTVLQERVRHMIQRGVPPSEILVVTFSRKAAEDLKRRLVQSGMPGADKVTALTFHGYCFRLIMQNYHRLGFTAPPTVWGDASDIRAVVKEAIRKASLDTARQQAIRWLHGINGLNLHSSWEDVLQAVRTRYPDLYARCTAQADGTLQAEKVQSETRQRKTTEKQAQGAHTAAGKGVDSASSLKAALERACLMEVCTRVYDALYQHCMKKEQQEPRAGDVPGTKTVKQMKGHLSLCKGHGHVASMYDAPGDEFGAVWRAYQDILHSCNAVDYDDLLSLAVELLSTDQVLARERDRFQMLLVDEFQDCNAAQIALVELLQKGRGFVTAVGDNMQSIYGFRGADHRSFQLFERAFAPQTGPSIRRPLDVNHRSRPEILQAANAAAAGTQPAYVRDKVMKEKPFFEIDKVKDAMAHLHLIVNLHDDVAFQRLLERPPKRLGGTFQDRLKREQAALALQQHKTHVSLHDAAISLNEGGSLTAAVGKNLNALLRFLDEARVECHGMSPSQALSYLLKRSGYLEWQKKQNDKRSKDKQQRHQSKVTRLQPGDSDGSGGDDDDQVGDGFSSDEEDEQSTWCQGTAGLPGPLCTRRTGSGCRQKQQGVYIGTVHSAKGLEWDAVWVRSHEGFGELPFPYREPQDLPPPPVVSHPHLVHVSNRLADREEHDAEGQRLVYVALTRAREHLFLYTERSNFEFDSDYWGPHKVAHEPSPFVRKIRRNAPGCCEVKARMTCKEIAAGMPRDWQHV
ncbi:hypothetical protein WJX73_008255 [Symbiochloris irregularis]|uniref:DNA 3'-5' helicase n=1 Tax=Symbiochloris irregularis TaxID=706552 RepID=A0AAW1NNE6_9CHLO